MAGTGSTLAGVIYYAREKYYQHIQTEVLELRKKYGPEPMLIYWKAYSLIMGGYHLEGMRELDSLVNFDSREVILCASMLHVYAHKLCETVDKEAVQILESRIRTERTTCGDRALYNAGMFMWLSDRHDKAREYVERMLKMTPDSEDGLTLRGWIDLTCGRESIVKRSIKYFEDALDSPTQPKLSEALFGKSKFYLLRYNFSHALEVVNQAVASYEGFLPALIEKMKIQLALQDWEQALETAQRCLTENSNCIEAIRMQALQLLARDGAYTDASIKIGELIQLIDRLEPKNHSLYHEASLSFARMAGGKDLVLQQTMTLVQRALSLAPINADYMCELAYQLYLSGNCKESLISYKKALNTDESSVRALAGMLLCQIMDGQLTEAEQQLEFLAEVQSSIGKQADLIFLNAILAQKRNKPSSDVMALLKETIDIHFTAVKGIPLSIKYFELINPHFLLMMAKAMMLFAPSEPAPNPSQIDPVLVRTAAVLDPISKSMPGMVSATYQLARVKFLSGELEKAHTILRSSIKKDSSFMEAHLLMAQLYMYQDSFKQCTTSLELALSSNFEVQNYPLYHLIKAQSERKNKDLTGALMSLQTAMNLLTRKSSATRSERLVSHSLLPALALSEKVTVYLELASVHSELGNTHESTKVMQDAVNDFRGTSEEYRIIIANADSAMVRGEVEEALSLLKGINKDHPYYIQAREKMAHIYLNKKKDKKMYIACYEELAKKLPGPTTSVILGDAYMSVQEPEKALVIYEVALKQNARNSVLASKIGQALIKTHHYNKAIIYYETALKSEAMQFLRLDLAELFLKLKQYDRAEATVKIILEQEEPSDLERSIERMKYIILLSKVYQKAGKPQKALKTLGSSFTLQSKIVSRMSVEQPDKVSEQKTVTARICNDLAVLSKQGDDDTSAIRFYHEALKNKPDYSEARLALAQMYLMQGEMEACNQQCVTLLTMDEDNEKASLIRADLLYQSSAYDEAIKQLLSLLEKKPAHFEALLRLVELYWKCGELQKAQVQIKLAESACSQSAYEPGLNYCKGLFHRYMHDINEALRLFNMARKDTDWGERALFNMIEICLSPDNELLVGETLKPLGGVGGENDVDAEDQMAIKTAEKLLQEVKPQSAEAQHKVDVLECYVLMGTRAKVNVDKALEKLMAMAATRRNDVVILLGLAVVHMMVKQVPRARNQLKIASKLQWIAGRAMEFEKTWLLLADVYIQSGKYDLAQDLLIKCITYNKSCSKAWEYRGFISEKEQAYRDAAGFYEKAWKCSFYSYPTIGFKLAFNHLKAKWYVGAIDVSLQVLDKHPNYPKIRKDILDKARASLRA